VRHRERERQRSEEQRQRHRHRGKDEQLGVLAQHAEARHQQSPRARAATFAQRSAHGERLERLCGLERRLLLGDARWCTPRLPAGRSAARLRRLGLDRAQLAHRGAARTESLAMVERPAAGLQAARHGAFLDGDGAVAAVAMDPYEAHATHIGATGAGS
jgi:hypothetical protein